MVKSHTFFIQTYTLQGDSAVQELTTHQAYAKSAAPTGRSKDVFSLCRRVALCNLGESCGTDVYFAGVRKHVQASPEEGALKKNV